MRKQLGFLVVLITAAWAGLGADTARPATRPATQPAKEMTLPLGGGVSMKLVWIPAGTFAMGSGPTEQDRRPDEGPVHEVRISRGFYMGATEVTQGQWKAVMNATARAAAATPWQATAGQFARAGDENAASAISWVDASQFCQRMAAKTGKRVRLPTEAEWEYACRAGSSNRFFYGDDADAAELPDYAWFDKNGYKANAAFPHPVAQKKPNAWGLYDMCGNVNEWCSDWMGPYPSGGRAVTDPAGPGGGAMHVFRGGSFMTAAAFCRSAARNRNTATRRVIDNGLRVVVVP